MNRRFAPLQLLGLAHPISTRGAHHIDYVLTSMDVDVPDDDIQHAVMTRWDVLQAQQQMRSVIGTTLEWQEEPIPAWQQWDEVAMRMPGWGFLAMKPAFLHTHTRNNSCDHTRDTFIIFIPCTLSTLHHAHLDRLRQMHARVKQHDILFRFVLIPHDVVGVSDDTLRYHVLYRHLTDVLGTAHVELHVLPAANNATTIRTVGTRYDIIASLAHDADVIVESYPHGLGHTIGALLAVLHLR